MMKAYIHGFGDASAEGDFKRIVPDALMRRRMSRIVRNGVSAAWAACNGRRADAILTATSMGCMADSEKFLENVIGTDEQLLSPTSFIQSTFNTVGATVALLQGNHGCNMTYSHGRDSLMSALLDGVMLLEEDPGKVILAGAVEELTPVARTLLHRMRYDNPEEVGGACFFLLSASESGAAAEIGLVPRTETSGWQRRHTDPLDMGRRMIGALVRREDMTFEGDCMTLYLRCL